MKKLLYFLIGFVLSLSVGKAVYACDYDPTNSDDWNSGMAIYHSTVTANYQMELLNENVQYSSHNTWFASVDNPNVMIGAVTFYYWPFVTGAQLYYAWNVDSGNNIGHGDGVVCASLPDTDEDGISDWCDLNGTSSDSYTAAISGIVYNTSTGDVVAGEIMTSMGDIFSFGTVPEDLNGYTFNTVDSGLVLKPGSDLETDLINLGYTGDDINLVSSGNYTFNDDGSVDIPSSFTDIKNNSAIAETPSIQTDSNFQAPTASTGTETDNEALLKITSNTAATAANIERLGDYIKQSNDYLAKINAGVGDIDGSTIGNLTVDQGGEIDPAALATAIGDELQDPAETYTATGTDNISVYVPDETALAAIATKYGDRWTAFTTVISDSDLFTVPFGDLFTFTGGGSATTDIDIGSWGGTTNSSMTFDFSTYSSIWEMLGLLLKLLVGFAAFKILVVHHA